MSDEPLTNAAVEYMRASFLHLNKTERDEFTVENLTDDFVYEDRRSGLNNGLLHAAAFVEAVRTAWGVGQPKRSPVNSVSGRLLFGGQCAISASRWTRIAVGDDLAVVVPRRL